jgi:DNA-binding protein HU-beta
MNKQQLIARVAEKTGASRADAARAVEAVFESIAEGLHEDGIVRIGKWGTYRADEIDPEP